MKQQCMIVVEGPDGCGKSTVASVLKAELSSLTQQDWVSVTDPSSGPVGQLIRGFLRGEGARPLDALGYLFMADRMDQHDVWFQPLIVADRYMLSTWVYQHDFMPSSVLQACLGDPRLRVPDVVVFLDAPLELCIERCARRKSKSPEVFEARDRMARQHERYQMAWRDRGNIWPAVVGRVQISIPVEPTSSPADTVGRILEELAFTGLLSES